MISSQVRRVILITGSNRGLGQITAQKLLDSPFASQMSLILTARDVELLERSKVSIMNSLSETQQKVADISCQQLDISDLNSINKIVKYIQSKYKQIDVVYNNAGIVNKQLDDYSFKRRPDRQNLINTFNTNFYGTINLTHAILPLLSSDGKILNISSNLGCLSFQSSQAKQFLQDPNLKVSDLIKAADNYVQNAPFNDTGLFCNSSYHASKVLLNAYTRFVGPKILGDNQSMYAISPGWVKTRMGGEDAPTTIEEEAPYLRDLTTKLPFGRNELSFKFLENMKEIEY